MANIYTSLAAALRMKCVEPRQRNKDGMRWVVHRFPIKHGISIRDAMIRDAMRPNPFFELLTKKDPK